MIISIDGPAGSGKSTVAELLSKQLGFIHFNSGELYRGVTAYLMKCGVDFSCLNSAEIPNFTLTVEMIDGIQHVFVNGEDFTPVLHNNIVSQNTPFVSTIKQIREKIDACQKAFASGHNVVIDGRDIGSFVFPDADFKFYLDCSIAERAKRRFLEEQSKGSSVTLKEIEQQIAKRDEIDRNKTIAPLVVPKNAIIIDSTSLTINQVVDLMKAKIK